MGCQWIPGEPSAEDGCKCGRPARAIGRAPRLRSIPYCDAHLARAYLPRTLHWLKLREFSAAANALGSAPDPLAPWTSMFARVARRGSRP